MNGKGTDDFTNLWKVSLISSMLPLVSLCLIPLLVPTGRMDEKHEEAGQPSSSLSSNTALHPDGHNDEDKEETEGMQGKERDLFLKESESVKLGITLSALPEENVISRATAPADSDEE